MNKTVNAILCTIVFCIVLTSCTKKDIESQDQRVEKIINGGQLYLIVETDKTIYDYDDYIYVTATLVNKTDKTITLNMPISKGNAHQELSIIIENDGNQLIDVDMHQNQQNNDKELFYLKAREKYVQNMRFSTRQYNEYSGENVIMQEKPPAGSYKGLVATTAILDDEYIPCAAEFYIEINPLED